MTDYEVKIKEMLEDKYKNIIVTSIEWKAESHYYEIIHKGVQYIDRKSLDDMLKQFNIKNESN